MKQVILPIDGCKSSTQVMKKLEEVFSIPGTRDIISHIKFNDILYGPDGCTMVEIVRTWLDLRDLEDVMFFFDLKLSDTWGTNINILEQYKERDLIPDILTIRECCSSTTFKKVSELLPETTLALVSVLTDTSAEECLERYGKLPFEKMVDDLEKVEDLSGNDDILEALVCSPLEVAKLREKFLKNFPHVLFIVPGIRDKWMLSGQQKRSAGVRQALENGADYVVMGSQLTKGNPGDGISPEESVRRTIEEMKKAQMIVPHDDLQTLKNFGAVYISPRDDKGNFKGPLVAYAGLGKDGKPKIGYHYYNLALIEKNPRTREYFAQKLARAITESPAGVPDVILGAPMGGIIFATTVANLLGCKMIFAEKKVLRAADPAKNIKEESEMVIKRHVIDRDDTVLIFEDLANNFSTTEQLRDLIETFDAEVHGIACIVNRSLPQRLEWADKPVISVINIPTEQYEQTDENELVQQHLAEGNIVLKPKHDWPMLEKAMQER